MDLSRDFDRIWFLDTEMEWDFVPCLLYTSFLRLPLPEAGGGFYVYTDGAYGGGTGKNGLGGGRPVD